MTPAQYALFAPLFDAVLGVQGAADAGNPNTGLQLHGEVAGAALRYWGVQQRIDIKPEVLRSDLIGGSWTALRATLPGDAGPAITVHLNDTIYLPRESEAA
jgi:hypothetical protein